MPRRHDTIRTLPDGTRLSILVQDMFSSYAEQAHDGGSERAHGVEDDSNTQYVSMRTSLNSLMDELPAAYAFKAYDVLNEYLKLAYDCHDRELDLCGRCTQQWLATTSPSFHESGLNADLYTILARG